MSIQTCKFDGQSRLGKKSRHTDRLSLEAGNSFSKKWKKGTGVVFRTYLLVQPRV